MRFHDEVLLDIGAVVVLVGVRGGVDRGRVAADLVGEKEALVVRTLAVDDLDDVFDRLELSALSEEQAGEDQDDEDGDEDGHGGDHDHQDDDGEDECGGEQEDAGQGTAEGARGFGAREVALAKKELDDHENWLRDATEEKFPLLESATQVHVGEQDALPVTILLLRDVVHDEPGPDMEVPVVHTLENEPDKREAEKNDGEGDLVILQFDDVGVESDEEKNDILDHEDHVKEQLSDQR